MLIIRSTDIIRGTKVIHGGGYADEMETAMDREDLLRLPTWHRPEPVRELVKLIHKKMVSFDHLRTKEQLGYVVYSGVRTSCTTMEFHYIIQSEKTPQALEARIESFLLSFRYSLAKMSETEFAKNKMSLIAKHTEKVKNLGQETARHWHQITTGYYDYDYAQQDGAQIETLAKDDMLAFYDHYIHPESKTRAKLSINLIAQAKRDVRISELIKTLDLNDHAASQAATDFQAKLTAVHHDESQELEGLKEYLRGLPVAEEKIDLAVEAWKKLSTAHRSNGVSDTTQDEQESRNGTTPTKITDVRDFKSRLPVTAGSRPVKDLSEYEEALTEIA